MNHTEDPMDKFSRPYKKVDYKLGTMFYMEPRKNPDKPGRELIVAYDDRFPLLPDFELHYSYFVRFFKQGNLAGNHYHHKKRELFIPIQGDFTVILENIETKEQEKIALKQPDYSILYVNSKTAHVVLSDTDNSTLLVIATSPNNEADEYSYVINQ
jgi:dTDP-4-dehydrorhamnose 3,5-epimerase-like enzyme